MRFASGMPTRVIVRAHVRQVRGPAAAQVALHGRMPLLHVARAQAAIDAEHALPQPRFRRERDWRDRWARGQREGGRDVVERALRGGLEEREGRCREGRGDPGLFDPHQAVPATHDRVRRGTPRDAQARPEVQSVELAGGPRLAVAAEVHEAPRIEVEDGRLVLLLGRGEVERVAQPGVDRQRVGHAPVVLDEELLACGRGSGSRPAADRWRRTAPGPAGSWRTARRCWPRPADR